MTVDAGSWSVWAISVKRSAAKVCRRGDSAWPFGLLAQWGFSVVDRELRPERFKDRLPAFPVAAGVGHAAVEVGAEVGDLARGGQQPQKGLLHDVLGIAS